MATQKDRQEDSNKTEGYPFVPIHRDLLDHALLHLSGSGVKALLVIMRKIIGQADPNNPLKRKVQADISFSQFRAAMGGSNTTIQKALDEVIKAGYVIRIDRGPGQAHAYRLNLAFNTDSDMLPKAEPEAKE